MSIEESRKNYERSELLESTIDPDPIAQLRAWIDDAFNAGAIEPNAMCVSTVGVDGKPSSRIVLLR